MEQKNNNKMIAATVIVLAVVAFGAYYSMKRPSAETPLPVVTQQTTTQTPPVTMTPSSMYKDGSYVATASYSIPEDNETEKLSITLVVQNDVVVDSTVTQEAKDKTSKMYQSMFADEYKQFVVGKKLSELKLDKVSGSSLTPKGFNAAVELIKQQAKA